MKLDPGLFAFFLAVGIWAVVVVFIRVYNTTQSSAAAGIAAVTMGIIVVVAAAALWRDATK